ncbi:MAG: ferrous iron transport protein B, partial [Spirochaetota bacterium]
NFLCPGRIWQWDNKKESFFQKILDNLQTDSLLHMNFILNNTLKSLSGETLQQELPTGELLPTKTLDYITEEFKKSGLSYLYQDELIEKSILIKKIVTDSLHYTKSENDKISPLSVKLDRFLLHPFFGLFVFFAFMALIFQVLFSWSELPMQWIETATTSFASLLQKNLSPGPLRSLLTDGIVSGVGSVLVFVPQITFLFLFISIMEESGYMARASFVMDKIMGKFGLSGKSFIPLLSSSACAIPGIMGARTIENHSDRMITILVSPLITCSARYPVYILVIGTVFPSIELLGFLSLKAMVLFALFLLGIITSLLFALLFRKTYFRSEASYFILELPTFQIPSVKNVAQTLYQKIKAFLTNAGTIILYASIILWFLSNYPQKTLPNAMGKMQKVATPIEESYAGSFGKLLEPAIQPLGFDWKIGVALLTSFAAREVMVSTLHIIYKTEGDETSQDLKTALLKEIDPKTGKPIWNALTGISILIFFAYACQCMSTLAIVRKETNSWLWPGFLFLYMTTLAYCSSLLVYQIGRMFL